MPRSVLISGGVLAAAVAGLVGFRVVSPPASPPQPPAPAPALTPSLARLVVPTAVPAPAGLPKFSYRHAPPGFPADSSSRRPVTESLTPARNLPVYDAPGGTPRAYLPKQISGLATTVPIVDEQPGWVAVLLPSVNRRVGWLPATGWKRHPLRDRLVVSLKDRELTWFRDGHRRQTWKAAIGGDSTPTPHGRTFVMGRTGTVGDVYAGLDALVLGAVPDDRESLAPALRDAHTGIHGWRDESAYGRAVSNGCVRLPPDAQRALLDHIAPGTIVDVTN